MKPLPAQDPTHPKHTPPSDGGIPSLPENLSASAAAQSIANRRTSTCATHRAYPWLLVASTAIAGAFCTLYITKPVLLASPNQPPLSSKNPVFPTSPTAQTPPSLTPNADHLPSEKISALQDPVAHHHAGPPAAAFEQTNLRVQHILNAQAPGGLLAKIDLDVPVLYQSRKLRWTPAEVTEARELMLRLQDYQEKSGILRSEGADLLAAWNQLVEKSIPSSVLRADSPTLPANQQDTEDSPRPATLDTTELIKLQPAKK
jgi:hypothetical protein